MILEWLKILREEIFYIDCDYINFILFCRFIVNVISGEIFVVINKGCNCIGLECEDSDLNWEKNLVYYLIVEV